MNREDYFLVALDRGPHSEEEAWARLENLTAEEAVAVKQAIEISGRPYNLRSDYYQEGLYILELTPESETLKNPGVWLAFCREAQQGEELVKRSSCYEDNFDKYHLIVMAKQFADLVRGKLVTAQNREGVHDDRRFEVWDEDTSQSLVFDAIDAQKWGPVEYGDQWNGEFWEYQVEETLYRHCSGHWSLVNESTFYEAPCSCGKRARRIDKKQAIAWLVRHGYEIPADMDDMVVESFFKPGEPILVDAEKHDRAIPSWHKDRGELTFQSKIIKRIRSVSVAKNVVRVLDVFQEENWPDRIDDPLDPSKDQQRLHETIKRLNDNLEMIRFRADGTGQGILWELIAPSSDLTAPESPRESEDIPF